MVSPPGTVNAATLLRATSHRTRTDSRVTSTSGSTQPRSRCSMSATTLSAPGETEVIRIPKSLSLVTVTVRSPVLPGESGLLRSDRPRRFSSTTVPAFARPVAEPVMCQ
ncbi:hypothetical protein [Actinoplanes sp. NPDC049599]|uniref:hypothetical protein n=1 Tax=Actinoplanes sp. NPDC049599 TaxID=3363903 RepID=UPI0037B53352